MSAQALKPCPFCGGTGIPMHTGDCYFTMRQRLKDAPKGDLSLVPEIFDAWNRRPAPAAGTEKDAERFQSAIAIEDNAETLYAAVLNHAPDGNAIRAELDAAILAHTKAREGA